MNPDPAPPPSESRATWAARWRWASAAFLHGFHRYATWLVGISWKRFIVLSLGLLIMAAILAELPPFSWRMTETIEEGPGASPAQPKPTRGAKVIIGGKPLLKVETPASGAAGQGVDISIDERGIRVKRRGKAAKAAASGASGASGASAAASAASAASPAAAANGDGEVRITLPQGVDREAVREAVNDAKGAIEDAIREQREAAEEATAAAREAEREARRAIAEANQVVISPSGRIKRTRRLHWGDFLTDLAFLWILASAIIKATYKGRIQAEVKAAQATETAEAESLKRQLVEARLAAMQAQVEPHFLFNTLASIDHLIETDPPRASRMQKNLIALLRASMPDLREGAAGGRASARDLGRELQVIRPYLEILQVRMEERLRSHVDVPAGLLSAEFPPLMLQTLVENAIKHGLEPKAEGGQLTVRAEIVHGRLQVSVSDTGLGLGGAETAGTGVGLANIRERLRLLYGAQATLTVAANPGGGTLATIALPYRVA
ncbi:MAG: histidine kinase, partial [Rubrivivax sp.]|nr:histidine kinase [Rubrivivax sp.]